jgi:uncharacterized protein (DUF1810 family)
MSFSLHTLESVVCGLFQALIAHLRGGAAAASWKPMIVRWPFLSGVEDSPEHEAELG